MATNRSALVGAIGEKLFWNVSYKHRRVLIPILLVLIAIASIVLIQNHVTMEAKLRQLSAYEPVYVLATKRDFNVGDVIDRSDLKAVLFYKREFEKMKAVDPTSGQSEDALITCTYDASTKQLTGFNNLIGRVVRVPILKDSMIRRDHLAEEGALPGLKSLIAKEHSLVDVVVEQIGFNIFIKPGDSVDLYQVDRYGGSAPIIKDVEVILVDSMPLGQAPFQVAVTPGKYRNLTIAVPNEYISKAIEAKKKNILAVTYNHAGEVEAKPIAKPRPRKKPKSLFQNLMLITGDEKKVLGK